jgi:hypothetical protein
MDLASNWLVSLECRTCQQISHNGFKCWTGWASLFWTMEQNNSSHMLTLRDHCRWLLLSTAAWTQCWCSLTHTAVWLYVLLAHLLLSIFLWSDLIGKHYCLGNKSEEKICFGFNHLLQTCIVILHTHPCCIFFPARSRTLLGLGAFGVHLTPLKCRLLLVCAIWAHKPLEAGYITTCLTVEYAGFSIYLSVAYQVVVPLLVSEDEKALVTVSAAWQKYIHFSLLPHMCQSFLSSDSQLQWLKALCNRHLLGSQHMCLHIISLLYTSRFASVLFFLGKQFWCLKMLALNSLLAGVPQRSSWQNCLPSC